MQETKEILLGIGIESLRFGATREEVENLLGEADEKKVEDLEEDGSDYVEYWHYEALEIELAFDREDDFRLGEISTWDSSIELDGVAIIGLSFDEFLNHLKKMKLGEYEVEDLSSADFPNFKQVSFFDDCVDFWFKDDLLDQVEWGYFWKDEQTPLWPNDL